ncbi:MAG: hypothetical protein LBV12_05300 [Puniceicoccales bacterium]|jgi:hypothetical protein|nr:hypothetical protein [Puniceicoccales bacterium]
MAKRRRAPSSKHPDAVVVDTNILLVANGINEDADHNAVTRCARILDAIQEGRHGLVLIDEAPDSPDYSWILSEYQNKTRPWDGQYPGDLFVRWVIENQFNESRVLAMPITPRGTDKKPSGEPCDYEEFPSSKVLWDFDASDRKFVAVAAGYQIIEEEKKAIILEASDSDFRYAQNALKASGIELRFLCPNSIKRKKGADSHE